MSKLVRVFEDLEVFKRAYRMSLEVHKATLHFPKIEQYALGDQIPTSFKVDLREHRRRFWQATPEPGGVQTLLDDGVGLGRRNANLAALRARSWIHPRDGVASVARRISRDSKDAAGPSDEAKKPGRRMLFFLIPDP
jgi:hypothetical protein